MYTEDLERAAIKIHSEQIVVGILGFSISAWLMAVVILKPGIPIAALLLPIMVGAAVLIFRSFVRGRAEKRAKQFNEQLEMVLRMMSSGLRVGLGLRQALVLVTEDVADPARVEFARAVGETNIGMTLNDALEGLGRRMPSDELRMMIDAIRVQSQTGGNLAKILDHLASTIKSRREIRRKSQRPDRRSPRRRLGDRRPADLRRRVRHAHPVDHARRDDRHDDRSHRLRLVYRARRVGRLHPPPASAV